MARSDLFRRPERASRRRRALGQHFLRNAAAADQLVDHLDPQPGEPILEIGPGRGVLTRRLLARGATVVAIEVDARLAAELPGRLGDPPALRVVAGDALEADLEAVLRPALEAAGRDRARLLANLPYSVGTAILGRLLQAPDLFASLTVMLQREVAERIVAAPGSRTYGSLSVLAQHFTEPRIVMRLAPGSFEPPPAVQSAVVTMPGRAERGLAPDDERAYPPFIRTLFGHRRRTLPHNLLPALGREPAEAAAALRAIGIDPARRPETLDREECRRVFLAVRARGAAAVRPA